MNRRADSGPTMVSWKAILLAGWCGGVAEILWIALYCSLTGLSAGEVAREVTATLYPAAASLPSAPALGVAIHLVLSLALGLVFARTIWIPVARHFRALGVLASAIAALIAVWAVNFLIILPILNPGLLKLMPLAVTLTSKILFGAGMAAVLLRSAGGPHRHAAAVQAA